MILDLLVGQVSVIEDKYSHLSRRATKLALFVGLKTRSPILCLLLGNKELAAGWECTACHLFTEIVV